VLYNGEKPFPNEETLKLSELFESTESLGISKKEFHALELVVRIININMGKNEEMAKKCQTLAQYSVFISKVREFQKKGLSLKGAVEKTVPYCRKHDILKELMEKHAKEIMSMLTTEWNWDTAKKVWQEEAREEGLSQGREEGIEVGLAQGLEEGKLIIAKNLLSKGSTLEFVHEITGISLEKIKELNQ
jgi:predicted transposase/invertase (TIGR01784 family)